MKLKQNEDFDFCIGSALYKMQQRLTGQENKIHRKYHRTI